MTLNRPLLKSLILLLILILAGIFVMRYQKTTTKTAPSSLKPTPTAIPIQESKIHSPDGTMKLMMRRQINKDSSKSFSFFVADISGKNQRPLFTKTVSLKAEMSLPQNSFSPDNKYLYLQENEGNTLNILVFKATGLPFSNNQEYLDVGSLLTASKAGNFMNHVTGWVSPTLIQINTLTDSSPKGPSYWFDVTSHVFLLH